MRITERYIYDTAKQATGQARDRMQRATMEAATGLRVRRPGDDPVAAGQEVRIRAEVNAHNSSTQVLQAASSELDVVDGALGGISDALQRGYELAVGMANGVLNASERKQAAIEVDGLLHQVLTLANVKVGDRYVFGGTEDTVPPYTDDGGFQGNAEVRKIEIYPGIEQSVSVPLDKALRGSGTGDENVIAVLKALSTALNEDATPVGAGSLIGELGKSIDQIEGARVQAGTMHNMLSMALTAADTALLTSTERKSDLTEVDAFDAANRLAMSQRAMEAAITASAQSFKFTLLNKIG